MKKVPGQKDNKELYKGLIGLHIPENIKVYVEPFGGSFCLNRFFPTRPEILVYNDIIHYDFDVIADHIHHLDYREIIAMYDSVNTFFYFDVPYYGKEQYYGMKNKDDNFHIDFKASLEQIKGQFIISYERCSFIERLFSDFNIYEYQGLNPFLKKEIIIKR